MCAYDVGESLRTFRGSEDGPSCQVHDPRMLYNEVDAGHLARMALLTFFATESPFSILKLIIVLLEILHAYIFFFPNSPVLIVASVYGSWQQNLSLWCFDDDFCYHFISI